MKNYFCKKFDSSSLTNPAQILYSLPVSTLDNNVDGHNLKKDFWLTKKVNVCMFKLS